MTQSFLDYVESQQGVEFDDDANYASSYIPKNYSVTDFKNDPVVQQSFEVVTDYLSENSDIATALIDSGATAGEQDDVAEFMRDDVYRIGAPAAKAMILKDAPENVKEAYRTMQTRFDSSSVTGVGEIFGAVADIGSDVIFNPEMIATLGSVISAPATLGGSVVASQAAKKTAGVAARNQLKKAIQATGATLKNNPKAYATAMGGYYGGAGSLAIQSMDVSLDKRSEISLTEAGSMTAIGAVTGYGLYRAGSAIGNKYFQKSTDPQPKPTAEEAAELFDEAAGGKLLPKAANDLVEQLGLKLEDDVPKAAKPVDKTPKGLKGVWKPLPKQGTLDFGDAVEKSLVKFVKDIGGGEKTQEEIRTKIRTLANAEVSEDVARNEIKQFMYEKAATLTGTFFGKAAGVLSPHLKVSGTARQLQERLSYEFGIKTDLKSQKAINQDLSEVQREVTGHFNEKFRAIVDELNLADKRGDLADSINDALMVTMRSNTAVNHSNLDVATNRAINKAAQATKELYNDMGVSLKDIGAINKLVDNYIPRMWDRKAIEDNQNKFIDLLVSNGGMGRSAAKQTVKDMLNIKNQIDVGGGSGYFFSSKRKLVDIGEDAAFQQFLNKDVLGSLHAYTYQAGKAIAKHRVLGVNNVDQFQDFWVNRIRDEVVSAGGKFKKEHADQITALYKHATGEGLKRFNKVGQNIADGYGLVNRVAYLGLATVSSLTEVMLNLSRGGFVNSVKGLKEAMDISNKHITGDLKTKLMNDYDLTAAEALAEMRKFSINVNQNLSQIGNRLAGDDLVNEKLQGVSNKFFRANMLDQWTKFVQTVSFSTGKGLIRENLEALSAYGGKELDKRGKVLADELKELGINYKEGVAWFKDGAKNNTNFYNEHLLRGAARYTDSMILQPTAMSGLKPLLHSNPRTGILFQLLGYPIAFTNTVMKQTGKRIVKAKSRNLYKVVPAAMLMTGVARFTNYVRTGGNSEKGKTQSEINFDALQRWGGNSIFPDMIDRASQSAKYTKSNVPYAAMPFGPVASDSLSLIQQGLIPTLANKTPVLSGSYFGKQILGEHEVKNFKDSSKQLQQDVFGGLIPKFDKPEKPVGYNIGGLVAKGITKVASNFNSTVNKTLQDATDGVLNSKTFKKSSRELNEGLDKLQSEGVLNLEDNDTLSFVNSLIINEVRKKDMPLKTLEGMPEFKRAVKSQSTQEAEVNWEAYQDASGFSEAHKDAIKNISNRQYDLDPEGKIGYAVSNIVRNTRNRYQQHTKPVVKAFVEKQKSGFFSAAHRAALELEGSKPKAGQHWLNKIKKSQGVTEEELDWTGAVERFGNQKPVKKEEVVEYFEDTKFDMEIKKGSTTSEDVDMPYDDYEDAINMFYDDPETLIESWLRQNAPEELENIQNLSDEAYEELAESVFVRMSNQFEDGGQEKLLNGFDFKANTRHLEYSFEGSSTKNYREIVILLPQKFKRTTQDFTHLHFPSIKNPVAHVRLADVDPAKSKTKTLLIDEIQSDAHQGKNKTNIPLPFTEEKKWALVGLKRAMVEAAEGGYEQIALTTGRMQAERNAQEEATKQISFYDKTLIKLLQNNFADKYNVKIKNTDILQNGEPVKLPVMKITDKMRRDIKRGLPMFAEGGLVTKQK